MTKNLLSDREKENIANLRKLRSRIKKDIKTVASVNAAQKALEKLSPSERRLFNKEFPGEMQKFRDIRKNVLARKEEPKKSMTLPKPKPKKKPLPKTLPKLKPKKKSGVTFDTTGTLPGRTIRKNK